jgi:hypothetical protein
MDARDRADDRLHAQPRACEVRQQAPRRPRHDLTVFLVASGAESPRRGNSQPGASRIRVPQAYSRRAIYGGNLVVAEITAREIGRINLVEALELTALIAKRDPKRHRHFAARWLWRCLGESEAITIDDAAVAVGLLLALGGPRHDEALLALLGMTERASSRG